MADMKITYPPLRSLHIGVGNRGAHILKLAMEHGCVPMALFDVRPELLGVARDIAGLPASACYTDLEEALNVPDLQACIITSPAQFHGNQMRAALERGLHIFIAKPMTYDLDEARHLVEAAERRSLVIVVDQQSQFSLTERTAAQWMHEKRFGAIAYGSFIHHRYRPDMAAFTGTHPFVWEQGVHSFNTLLAILGRRAVAVTALQLLPSWSAYNGSTVAMGLIEFEGGLPIQYLGTFDSRQTEIDIRLECENAAMRLHAEGWQKILSLAEPGGMFESTGVHDDQDTKPAECFNFQNFHKAIATGERVPNDGRDNLRTLALADAFLRSSREGRKVSVPDFDY